jgi:D-serine deaminase-like pyridoxal phosphate-dependent protein
VTDVAGNINGALDDILTPAALIDREKLDRNCSRMRDGVHRLGSRLRPHMKTLKSVEAARLALDPAHGGIAVSTLNEARYFHEHGFTDICCAVCLPPTKFAAAASLTEGSSRFSFFVDDPEVARAAAAQEAPYGIWIEIDSGEHRTGIEPDSSALVEIASAIQEGRNTQLIGVATHAGHAYGCHSIADIRAIAEQERAAATAAAGRLRQAGFLVPNVSVGSTPTATHAASAVGVTEFRAGVYMAGDLVQASLGSLDLDDVAFSVLATVISKQRSHRQIVIDAGGLALSKDRGARPPARDFGYGLVTDVHARRAFGDLIVSEVHQEHGEIRDVPPSIFDQLHVGTKVRVLPNHVCMTAAMYDRFMIVGGTAPSVEAIWDRTNGWP